MVLIDSSSQLKLYSYNSDHSEKCSNFIINNIQEIASFN